jgi:hypothetical protein
MVPPGTNERESGSGQSSLVHKPTAERRALQASSQLFAPSAVGFMNYTPRPLLLYLFPGSTAACNTVIASAIKNGKNKKKMNARILFLQTEIL